MVLECLVATRLVRMCALWCSKLPSNQLQRPEELKVNVGLGADSCPEGSGHCSGWMPVTLLEAGVLWHWEGAGVCEWAAHSPVLAGNSSLAPLGVAWREENQWQLSNGAALLCDLKLSTADV